MKGHRIVKDKEGNILEVHKMVGDRNTITKYPTKTPVEAPKATVPKAKRKRGGLSNAITS